MGDTTTDVSGAGLMAHKTWRTLEPLHGMIYFAPEAQQQYATLGLDGQRSGYFASRSAPLGPVPVDVVIATFFNFEPGLVRRAMSGVWDLTSPANVLGARLAAADGALRRMLGDAVVADEMAEAADLARASAEAASDQLEGRALFAAHAALPWPDEPHLVLWHAQTLLREYRGDAHIAALVAEGLTGLDALVSHAASGDIPTDMLRTTRAWSDVEWAAGVDSMRERGLVDGGAELSFTEAGRAQRDRIERNTDEASAPAYARLGEAGCQRLRELARPFSRAVVEAGGL